MVSPEKNGTESSIHKNSKRKFPKWIIVSIIVIVLLYIGILVFNHSMLNETKQNSNIPSSISTSPEKQCQDVQVSYSDTENYDEQEPYTKKEYYSESVPYTDQQCESKNLVYNIQNFYLDSQTCNQKVEECSDYTLGICTSKIQYCVDRSVVCSFTLNNLDNEEGTWGIDFSFYKQGSSEIEGTDKRASSLYAQDSETVRGNTRITTKEPYETSYSCRYAVANTPTKKICRDVIKYKEVQKSREVTAYKSVTKSRPVTKYRTETKCE